MINEKILLVGPSSDIKNFNKDYFLKAKEDEFLIVSYSDSLRHFLNIKFYPDFWSFIDPFTITRYFKEIKQHELKSISLLINNLYENKFKNFYEAGFTCNALKKTSVFDEIEKLNFDSFFNKVHRLKYNIVHYSDNIPNDLDLYSSNYLFVSAKKDTNICKFSHYLIPMTLFFFKNVKHLRILGFGQYDVGRFIDNKNKLGYKECVKSFNIIENLLKRNLKYIKVEFEGKKSYFLSISRKISLG